MSVGAMSLPILFIDDFFPDQRIGAGAPRAANILRALSASGAKITLWATSNRFDNVIPDDSALPLGVHVVRDRKAGLGDFLTRQQQRFRGVIVSRPHNMAKFRELLVASPDILRGAKVIYDAEALFASREILRHEVNGKPLPPAEAKRLIDDEIALARNADIVIAVNERTAAAFSQAGHRDVRVLGYAVDPKPTSTPFEARRGFVFVGPSYSDATPNADSLVWFIDRVLPRLRASLGSDALLRVAGVVRAPLVKARGGNGVTLIGPTHSLAEVYSGARVFVAPTRFAAGIPLKVYDAAAHGVPVVLTSVLATDLNWATRDEILVADSPEEFSQACQELHQDPDLWNAIRTNALQRVSIDCSPSRFDATVGAMMTTIASARN
jgi:hypothetical protein